MQQVHRDAIQSNFTSLVERTDLDSVVNYLFEKNVLSDQMMEQYTNAAESEKDRKRKLYRQIPMRGPEAFGYLVEALRELGYWDLVRDLDPDNPFVPMHGMQQSFRPIPPKKKPQSNTDDDFHSLTLNRKKVDANKNTTKTPPPPPPVSVLENGNGPCDESGLPSFTVIKSKKFMEDDDTKDLKLYRTRGRNRGILLDFTYTEFKNNIEPKRMGSDVDSSRLKYLFSELGFRRLGYLNLTRAETIDTLKSLNNVLVDIESVFVVVSSHGYERPHLSDTDFRCTDGLLISLYEVVEYFNNHNMPALIGVPKVFIFQMCRGNSNPYSHRAETDAPLRAPPHMPMPQDPGAVQHDGQPIAPDACDPPPVARPGQMSRSYSDILIAHSTLPGFVAHRDPKHGSWYIQELCNVFAERAHDCHVEKLFTLVDQSMQAKYNRQTSSVDRWGFNKRLYLHPGLYES